VSRRLIAEWYELYDGAERVGEPRFATRDAARAWRRRAGVRVRLVRVRRWAVERSDPLGPRIARTLDGLVTIWR
jgi:hypothetical protein